MGHSECQKQATKLRTYDSDATVTGSKFSPFSATTHRKALSALVATAIFACLGGLTTLAAGRPLELGLANAVLTGIAIGLFEEFYLQSQRGSWMRSMHPLRSIAVYVAVIVIFYLVAAHTTRLFLGRLDDLPVLYRRLPYVLAFFTLFSMVGVLSMRIIHFIGLENLFYLMVGTYHRPVQERKVLLFLDINGSTALGEKLGALSMRSFVGKFLIDVSQPVTDHGGEIYDYKGDGLIAVWNWAAAIRGDAILKTVDAMFNVIAQKQVAYERSFGIVPSFRIGIHGGDVVVSEQGDTKRSIAIYGDAINIAARMEEAARAHGVRCVLSGDVADALANRDGIREIGEEAVKGISIAVRVCEYRPRLDP
jgi:class 3 adenylate cyclase